MNTVLALDHALDELERIQANLAAVLQRQDDARRSDMVKFRRLLSTQIALVGQLTEPLFPDAPEDRATCRRLYSGMRSAAALHQAEWPAVRLGEFADQHLASALNVRAANRAFIDWLRRRLADKKGKA